MQNLDQFIAEQNKALEKKKAELAEFANLGNVDGLEPWLIFSKLYGVRHIGFKLVDLEKFIAWAKENCRPVFAFEGVYKAMYPFKPETKDYKSSQVMAEGFVKINYSTILREIECNFYKDNYRIGFKLPNKYIQELVPVAIYRQYSERYYGKREIEGWKKTGFGEKQYLRLSVDKQSADLETLLTMEQFEQLIMGK